MDNATAEYAFITIFFCSEPFAPSLAKEHDSALFSPPATLLSPDRGFDDIGSNTGSETGTHSSRPFCNNKKEPHNGTACMNKADRAPLDAIWKQVLDPILEYCKVQCLIFL